MKEERERGWETSAVLHMCTFNDTRERERETENEGESGLPRERENKKGRWWISDWSDAVFCAILLLSVARGKIIIWTLFFLALRFSPFCQMSCFPRKSAMRTCAHFWLGDVLQISPVIFVKKILSFTWYILSISSALRKRQERKIAHEIA